ncbi:hypothetical protein [Sphingomonas panacis]|nr:hypothetical protein [Sphingomonas panacis]
MSRPSDVMTRYAWHGLLPVAVIALGIGVSAIGAGAGQNASAPSAETVDLHAAAAFGISAANTAEANTRGFDAFFASPRPSVVHLSAGTYNLSCRTYTAASAVSILGAGAANTILRLPRGCSFSTPFMAWDGKADVRVSGLTIDLNDPVYPALQPVLKFTAYDADAARLSVDHIAILNGNSPSLQITVGATAGHKYDGVVISDNYLQMRPATTTNQCIALTTVNGTGYIPAAQVIGNVCKGSGIQIDGADTRVSENDVSGFSFGTAIYAQQNVGLPVAAASWANSVVTISHRPSVRFFVVGQKIGVQGAVPTGYNGVFTVIGVTSASVSYAVKSDPGPWKKGGYVISAPSNCGCLISGNILHDTGNGVDVNNAVHAGLENSCVNSIVKNNNAYDLGGSGFSNFASDVKYVGNVATNTGFEGGASAGEEADKAAFAIFDAGIGVDWYASHNVTMQGNRARDGGTGKVKYGYFEEPWHIFATDRRENDFRGHVHDEVVRQAGVAMTE